MKKIPILLLLLILLFSCENKRFARIPTSLNEMKKPCVVIAVKKRAPDAGFHGGHGSIIIKDSNGIYLTIEGNTFEGGALIASYNKGDTIQ